MVPETELGQVYKARADCRASSWVPQAYYSGKIVLKRQKMVSAYFIPSKSKQESLPHHYPNPSIK